MHPLLLPALALVPAAVLGLLVLPRGRALDNTVNLWGLFALIGVGLSFEPLLTLILAGSLGFLTGSGWYATFVFAPNHDRPESFAPDWLRLGARVLAEPLDPRANRCPAAGPVMVRVHLWRNDRFERFLLPFSELEAGWSRLDDRRRAELLRWFEPQLLTEPSEVSQSVTSSWSPFGQAERLAASV